MQIVHPERVLSQTLSPKQLGEAIGVSESSLKRWADEGQLRVTRTAGGHRRIQVAEAIRFVRDSGHPLVKPQILGLTSLARYRAAPAERQATEQRLRDALLDGRADEVRAIVLSSYTSGMSVAELCDGPIASAMRHIGDLWQHSREGILIEHRASDIVAQSLHQLRGVLDAPADDAPVAVGGAPDGDIYVLPSLMSATVLASVGWREINLGLNTPVDVIAAAAAKENAKLVWLAVSSDRAAERITTEAAGLAAAIADAGRILVVGGRAWPRGVKLKAPNAHVLNAMTDLDSFARDLG